MHIELHAKYFVHAHYQSKLKKKKLYQNNLSMQKNIESGQAIRKKNIRTYFFFTGIERYPIGS